MSEFDETRNLARVDGGSLVQARDISGTINFGAVQLPSRVEPALSGLPRKNIAFTGRDADLQDLLDLLDLLDPENPESEVIQVSAVAGLAGIGKTELAIQAAHVARSRGWFPGGVLFVNLFGYDPERRVEPGVALDGCLQALGLPSERIQAEAQDRVRQYRSILATFAERKRPILVVVDNASTGEQASYTNNSESLVERPSPARWTPPPRPVFWPACAVGCRWRSESSPRCWPPTRGVRSHEWPPTWPTPVPAWTSSHTGTAR